MIEFHPTEKQKRFIEAVDWFIDDSFENRASGRSTLVAWRYIHYAMKNPGRKVYLMDFGNNQDRYPYRKQFADIVIHGIIDKMDYELKKRFTFIYSDLVIIFN